MVDLREPLDQLIRGPRTYTGALKFPDPSKIFLYDDSLRDGEQMPGVAFSPEQKLRLCKLLAGMGIDVMDVAFPLSSQSDRDARPCRSLSKSKVNLARDHETEKSANCMLTPLRND
jgi:isopropylmalate/homocitrate/citramalate synthase